MLDELSVGPQPHMYTYEWCKTVLNSDLLDDDAYVAIYQRYCYMYTSLQFMNFTRLVPSNLTYNVKRKATEIHHLRSDTVNDNSEEKVQCTCCTCCISRTSILSDLFVSHPHMYFTATQTTWTVCAFSCYNFSGFSNLHKHTFRSETGHI